MTNTMVQRCWVPDMLAPTREPRAIGNQREPRRGRLVSVALLLGGLALSLLGWPASEAEAISPAVSSTAFTPSESGQGSATGEATEQESGAHWVNGFGVRVLRALLEESADANTILSPLSLATALAMTAQGATGDTADAFAAVLGYEADQSGLAAEALAILGAQLEREHADLILRQGNGLWLAPTLALRDAFAVRQREHFGAEVATVDFSDPAALETINAWFAERTAGEIPRLLDRLPGDARIVLGNALYVNGRWQTPFDPTQTRAQPFYRGDGQTIEVPMMHLDAADFLYRENSDHQALRLPFADPEFELLLALPAPGAPVAELLRPGVAESLIGSRSRAGESTLAGLPAASGSSAAPTDFPEVLLGVGFRPRPGRLELPRFDLGSGGDLSGTLHQMGLFQSQDFSRMAAEPLAFGPVVHKVSFAVDEAGAEAAAATAVVGVRSGRPRQSFAMVLDRPFLLGLQHLPSGIWLFLGAVGAP